MSGRSLYCGWPPPLYRRCCPFAMTPLVASLDFQRQSGQMKRKWSNEMTAKVHGQRGRTLVTMQAKGKGKKKDSDDSPYRDTVNLPQTKFNMRANSKQREPELQRFWEEQNIYEQLLQNNSGEIFTLHDGPPYANGDTHLGHALNKILKSIIVQFKLLTGAKARYVPGWDCHGLPIELKVLQSMSDEQRRELTPIKLRRKARDFALKTVKAQKEQFKRYGVWGDWERPYLTLEPKYEAAQLRIFGKLVAAGHIYRGTKPVHWSPSSQTALAEAELEYPEGHTSRSIYVAMPLESIGGSVPEGVRQHLEGAAVAIWTTTGWTIPANQAVAVNERLQYAIVEAQGEAAGTWAFKRLVVAEDMVEGLGEKLGVQLQRLGKLSGAELAGCQYRHPLFDRSSPVLVGGDYITTESGTGLVHTAPGHGQEDYLVKYALEAYLPGTVWGGDAGVRHAVQVGLRNNLPITAPVDNAGVFTEEAGPFHGLAVLKEGTAAVIEALQREGVLLKEERYSHKYPYDWRTKLPTIFRATDQWFVSVEGFRQAALDAIHSVEWLPASGIKRITSMVEGRSDWCISRQRSWGVPLPVLYYKDTGKELMTEESIEHMASVVEAKGTDAFWQAPVEELLPPSLRGEAPRLEKRLETMDVWFDSGTSWAGCVETAQGLSFPADLYLEGSDQHRGWFQSSLLTAAAVRGVAPYKQVLTHGFALDEKGLKMSKSLGNVVDPRTIMEGGKDQKKEPPLGADVLRLWVASVDYTGDVLMGPKILNQVSDAYRKLRFTVRFLLGNVHDFDPATNAVPYDALPATDRFLLATFGSLLTTLASSYETYQFYRVYQSLLRFAVTDLSNWYLDVIKDRLYVSAADSFDRRAAQTVLSALLEGMLPALAPILPHLAEDAWQSMPWAVPTASVFQSGWFSPREQWQAMPQPEQRAFRALKLIREVVNQVLEKARGERFLGSALEAKVLLHVADAELAQSLQALQGAGNVADPLRYAFIVSQAELAADKDQAASCSYSNTTEIEGVGAINVGVSKADGQKCQRCWNYSTLVGRDQKHPQLCERCSPVIRGMNLVLPEAQPAAEAAAVPM